MVLTVRVYGFERSPSCRAVLLTARALGLKVEFKEVDVASGEHNTEAFKKMNPAGFVPILEDDGMYIWESRAINAYLVDRYGKDDKLYPKDPKKRAMVDMMLYFDTGSFSYSMKEYMRPRIYQGKAPDPAKEAILRQHLVTLNTILGQRKFAAGDHITIADFSINSALHTLQYTNFNLDDYPNVTKWSENVIAGLPFYEEVVGKGLEDLRTMARYVLGLDA